jgi:hypothetical protein
MIDGRLDYCNSVLYCTSLVNINKLQRVQNSAARIVTKLSCADHIAPGLAELQWLGYQSNTEANSKMAVTAFKVLTMQEPSCLTEFVRFHTPTRQLRSSGRNQLHVDRAHTAFAGRTFCHAALAVWNSLPQLQSGTAGHST